MNEIIINEPIIQLKNNTDKLLIDRDIKLITKTLNKNKDINVNTFATFAKDEQDLNDYLTPYRDLTFTNTGNSLILRHNEKYGKTIDTTLHKNAIHQICNKFNIQNKHVSNLINEKSTWSTETLAYTLNKYIENKRHNDVGLIRTVGDETRGILSDSFHRYSTFTVYRNLLKNRPNIRVLNMQYDGLNSYMEVLSTNMKSFYIGDQLVNMMFGLQMRNSSFGTSALEIRPFSIKVVCSNGLTTKALMRDIHKSSKQSIQGLLSRDTLITQGELKSKTVNDIGNFIFSDKQTDKQIKALQTLGTTEAPMSELKKLTKIGVLQNEIEDIERILMNGSESDGLIQNKNTAYNVIQAISKEAQTKGLIREKELLDISGDLLQVTINQLN